MIIINTQKAGNYMQDNVMQDSVNWVERLEALHWRRLEKMCKDLSLDIDDCSNKGDFVTLLRTVPFAKVEETYNNMIKDTSQESDSVINTKPQNPEISTDVSANDLRSLNISKEGIRRDKLRADIESLESRNGKSYRDGRHRASFDDQTVHLTGGCLGPWCLPLAQPDGVILRYAKSYLDAVTIVGVDGQRATM